MSIIIKDIKAHIDSRGSLFEVIRRDKVDADIKLIHFSITLPGDVRGNHYHKRKIEWIYVAKGTGLLRYEVAYKGFQDLTLSDKNPKLVRISPGFGHAIKNVGDDCMFLIVAVSEVFKDEDPDTYFKSII